MKAQIKNIAFVLILLTAKLVSAQQPAISFSSEGTPLSIVLEKISAKYNVRFAFDSDKFKNIETRFSLKNSSVKDFLQLLNDKYAVRAKLIEGTWVLVLREPKPAPLAEAATEPKPKIITVSGYVKDRQTGENLLYCNVVFGPNKGAMTNGLGFFSYDIPEADSVRILISHLGYKRLDTLVSTRQSLYFALEPSDILIQAIEVRQLEKQMLEATPEPEKIAFNPLKSANAPRMSSDDLANALLVIPGVNFQQGSSPGLSIRGSAPTDNLVLFDGIPVLETSHLLGNMSVLNSKFVQQAFVSRGGFDAEFGGRAAGLIELTGKSGKNNRPYLDVSANLMNSNVLANIPVTGKFSVTAAWRRSFIDSWQNYLYLRMVDDWAGETGKISSKVYPTLRYQDLNAKVSFHPSDKLEMNVNFLYGDDFQSRDFTLQQTGDYYRNELMDSKNWGASFNWNWQINNRWYQSFTAGYSNLSKNQTDETGELEEVTEVIEIPGAGKGKGKGVLKTRERTYTREVYTFDNGDNRIEEYRLAWKTEYKTGIFRNQAGLGWTANSFSYYFLAARTVDEYPVDSVDNSARQYLANAFLQQYVQPAQQLKFRWGIRTNVDLKTGKTYWRPRGGVEFNPFNGLKFHYSAGIYNQFLSGIKRIDNEGHYNLVWYLPGENGAGTVKSAHHMLGGKLENDGWLVNVEGYLKNTKGKQSLLAKEVNSGDDVVISYYLHNGQEKCRGVDFFIQKKQGIFNHMAGYSLSETHEKVEGILNDEWFAGYNDRRHRLKLTEMVNWKGWSLSGSWQFGSGLPVINLTVDNLLENSARTGSFSQLDFALVKSFNVPHFLAQAGVSLLNVLDRENIVEVDYLRFASDTGSLSVRSDISALAFTPVFFVNFKIQ